MPNKMPLPDGARLIIEKLYENGHTAGVVGGSVRDFLIGREIFDYDITTSAKPSEVKYIFRDFRTVDTGIQHGTVTVIIDGTPFEVTTYRLDGNYLDSRHPESVTFTNALAEDLKRRDFTVNAICYNDKDGYIDLFDGIDDLNSKIIRAVGDPEQRFTEDALRIMRAIRFSSQLGFDIEENTAKALRTLAPTITKISRERILQEWKKLLAGKNAYPVIAEYRDIIEIAIPELSGVPMPPEYTFIDSDSLTRELLLFAAAPDAKERFSRASVSLRRDNATRRLGEDVLTALFDPVPRTKAAVARFLNKFDTDTLDLYLKVAEPLDIVTEAEADEISSIAESGIVYKISDLAIGGKELLGLGISGRAVGEALEYALDAVIAGECPNTKTALLEIIKFRK